MTVSDSPAATSLTNRYGAPKRAFGKRTKVLTAVVIAVLALAFVTWLAVGRQGPSVQFKDVGYTVLDSTMTHVDFEVTKDAGATAACDVKAMNAAYAVVGWKTVTIGPNGTATGSNNGKTTILRADVRTDSLAVTGVVDNCWVVHPG
ncbi:DUF4307 domain-containing protein [Specibacter cremeus]|uniref:DUF4307 domain-containing protein n=1 Tax=Specibacter cremeus TaxID=1629051 RepID=UPI001F0C98C9|nr:DUF4307 domain-containing protein [Specibacter cremeus]